MNHRHRYIAELEIAELPQHRLLPLAVLTAEHLGWHIQKIFDNGIFAVAGNTVEHPGEELTINIEDNKVIVESKLSGDEDIDLGRNRYHVDQFVKNFAKPSVSITQERVEILSRELRMTAQSSRENTYIIAPITEEERTRKSASTWATYHLATTALIAINIIVYIMMLVTSGHITPDSALLAMWGANYGPYTLNGEWWRLLTCCFLHGSLLHIFANMTSLYYVGGIVERLIGRGPFIVAYVLAGISGSVASLWWHSHTVSVGASGAIMGMLGVFLALLTTPLIPKSIRKETLKSVAFSIGINILIGFVPNIDGAAHIGGLVSGIAIGFACYFGVLKRTKLKTITLIAASLIVIVVTVLALDTIPDTLGMYNKKMDIFEQHETKALFALAPPEDATRSSIIADYSEGISHWKEALNILNEADRLDLPEAAHEFNKNLKIYCRLRIESYGLKIKSLQEETTKYDDRLHQLDAQIKMYLGILNKP